MDEKTADILERAKLRREVLLKRAQEEGINALKYKTDNTGHSNAIPIKKPSKIRRSSSFSDLSQKPVKDRLLSWKAMEKQQLENSNKLQPFNKNCRNQCGSLTNLDVPAHQIPISNLSSPKTQFSNEIKATALKSESSPQGLNKMFPSYSAYDSSNKAENKENILSKKHYFEPKFGPLTKNKLNSNSSNDNLITTQDADTKSTGIKKLGPATLVIQEKLSKLCQESWKKNQISEDIKKKKEEDMHVLTTRWKDGMLCNEKSDEDDDDDDDDKSSDVGHRVEVVKEIKMDQNGIPVPPPLPPPGVMTPKSWKNQTTPLKASKLNDAKTPLNTKPSQVPKNDGSATRDLKFSKELLTQTKNSLVSKNKIDLISPGQSSASKSQAIKKPPTPKDKKINKPPTTKANIPSSNESVSNTGVGNFNRLPKPFSKSHLEKKFAPVGVKVASPKNESMTSTDSFAENLINDFEKNLKAMGYHVNKGQESKAIVELESATEDERGSHSQKMGRHDPILRSHQPNNKARVQSNIENPVNRNIVSKDRPISVVERRKVVTNFSDHDVVTVMKKKCIGLETDANGYPGVKRSRRDDSKNFTAGNDLKRVVKFSSDTEDEYRVNVELIPDGDDDDEDTYGLDDDQLDTSPTDEDSLSSGSLKFVPPTGRMETYFSITDVKADDNDVYVQMSGSQNRRPNSSGDYTSEDCYAATEESDVYEEIVDSSPNPRTVHGAAKRHVSMRKAVQSEYSDEETSDGTTSYESDVVMRRKIAGNTQRARPFTTTNASFDPPGHSSPIPRNVNNFGGSCKNISASNGCRCNKTQRTGYRAKSPRAALNTPTGTQARLIAASHHHRREEPRLKSYVEQFIDRRGLPFQPISNKVGSNPAVPAKPARVKIQSLEELIEQEEKFSIQASNALSICMKKSHLWTNEAVECHRILLTTSKRKEILLNELKRLRDGRGNVPEVGSPVAGKLIVSGMRLPLKPEFIAKLGTVHDTTVTYFIVTIQSGESIFSSQTVSTKNPIMLGSLEIPGQLVLAGVPLSFSAFIEVYALTVPRDLKNCSSKKVHAVKKAAENASKRCSYKADDSDQSGLRASYFIPVGRLELNEENLNRGHFSFDGVSYPSPIQGTVHLKMKYVPERLVQYRGYLNVCLEGSREFSRKWCCLTQSEINLWRNASDELVKEPVMQIDLMSCIIDQLLPIAIDYHLQKDTFEMVVVVQPSSVVGRMKERTADKNCPLNFYQQNIYWFSADSSEECNTWCRLINRNLIELRTWHPYAIPPIKFRPPQTSPFIFDSLL